MERRAKFGSFMTAAASQIRAAEKSLRELDLSDVFEMDPIVVLVAERLPSYVAVYGDGIVARSSDSPRVVHDISDEQIRLAFKIGDVFCVLPPPARSETGGARNEMALFVGIAYNDREGWKRLVVTMDGNILVINTRHIDAHKVVQPPSEEEMFNQWQAITESLSTEHLRGVVDLVAQSRNFTNWQHILDTVPQRFPSEKVTI